MEDPSTLHLAALTPAQRSSFLALLDATGLQHEVDGDEVRFPSEGRATAQRLLLVAISDRPAEVPPDLLADPPAAGGPGRPPPVRPASLARRVAGAAVNLTGYLLVTALVTTVVLLATSGGGGEGGLGDRLSLVLTLAPPLLSVAFVALAGGTPGMLLFSMRVVDGSGRRPGWGRSAVRAAAIWGPYLGVGALGDALGDGAAGTAVTSAAALWFVVLAWSVHRGPAGRGWQDRAAGLSVRTVELRAASGRAR